MKKDILLTIVFFFAIRASYATELFYPSEVVSFLSSELPLMEQAVEEKNMLFFEESNLRMVNFFKAWGLGSKTESEIDKYLPCTNAMSNYLIVGLCKVSPQNTICEPTSFFPKFENNLESCRLIAENH